MEHHGTFGPDAFGRGAEHAARFFGTPQYIVGQTLVVIVWLALNGIAIGYQSGPVPVHPAQPRVLDPGRLRGAADPPRADAPGRARQGLRATSRGLAPARREMASDRVAAIKTETDRLVQLLDSNTKLTQQDKELTEQVAALTREIHAQVTSKG